MQWYGGHPTLDYSVISPVLGALFGPMALCAVSGLLSAIMFDRIVRHHFGSAWWIGSLWFAIGTATNLMVGRVAFAVGIAFGLATVLAIQHHLRCARVARSTPHLAREPGRGLVRRHRRHRVGAQRAFAARPGHRDRSRSVLADRRHQLAVPRPWSLPVSRVGPRARALGVRAVRLRDAWARTRRGGGERSCTPPSSSPRSSFPPRSAAT